MATCHRSIQKFTQSPQRILSPLKSEAAFLATADCDSVKQAGQVLTGERLEKQELALCVHLEPDQITLIRELEIHDSEP